MKTKIDNQGFTLVELMITLAMTGIIVTAVYSMYRIQNKSYQTQEQVTIMQQNIRSAIYSMVSEIRMAGYDPTFDTNAGMTTATVGRVSFTGDLDGSGALGGVNEAITYGLDPAGDTDGDGIVDVGAATTLGRDTGGGFQAVAEGIQAIEFLYTLSDDSTTTSVGASQLSSIKSVTISILATAAVADRKYTNGNVYIPASGTAWDLNGGTAGTGQPTKDNFRRRLLTTTVKCRNL